MADKSHPYRYRLTLSVMIDGDGQHADGDGATATERRLIQALADDPLVTEVHRTHAPIYMGDTLLRGADRPREAT